MKRKGSIVVLAAMLFVLCVGNSSPAAEPSPAGVWSCQSMAGEAFTGRPCRFTPWLSVNLDGSYVWGRESGTWKLENGALALSGRKGRGIVNEDGKLVFTYEANGKTYVQTMVRRPQ